jgi:hypothetical protein
VAVVADHRISLVGQPLALGDAVAQRLLIALQLARLPFAARLAIFLVLDDRGLPRGPTTDPVY